MRGNRASIRLMSLRMEKGQSENSAWAARESATILLEYVWVVCNETGFFFVFLLYYLTDHVSRISFLWWV